MGTGGIGAIHTSPEETSPRASGHQAGWGEDDAGSPMNDENAAASPLGARYTESE